MKRKRSKRSRLRGRRSCGMGARNNYRGKGTRGGKGMAGTGKRAGQKKTWILKYAPDYFGKKGFRRPRKEKPLAGINLDDIQQKMDKFVEEGNARKIEDGFEVELKGYKILSRGSPTEKLVIKASAFSEKAKEKIEKAGGSATVI